MEIARAVIPFALSPILSAALADAADFPNIPGWEAKGEAESFHVDSIWKAINGAAELYLTYGFLELRVRDYEKKGVEVSIRVFNQGEPLNAFGIFAREKNPQATPIEAGTKALAWPPHQCLMIKDRFYVKADAVKGKLQPADCRSLLVAMERSLPGEAELPTSVTLLPKTDQVAGTLGYTKGSYLGLGSLKNCLHALYTTADNEQYIAFTIVADEGESNRKTFDELSNVWEKLEQTNQPTLTREIPYRGLVAVTLTPKGIFGVADAGALDATLAALAALVAHVD